MSELVQLTEIGLARSRLDERELELIDRARQSGSTWTQIAGALGLASRQAAEQRRQRLVVASRSRRKDQDLRYAHSIVILREAVDDLHRSIAADRRWTSRFVRAALVRATIETALDAPPGGLFALAAQAAADLAAADLAAADLAAAEWATQDLAAPGSEAARHRVLPGYVRLAFRKVQAALSTTD